MNYNFKKSAFLLVLFIFSIFTSFAHAKITMPFEKIVFFGDSLSDNGNLFSDTYGFIPKSPPYFKGRFTNGLLWSEQIEKYFYDQSQISSSNYALGGQTAILHNPMNGYLPYTLTMSLDKYLLGSIFRDRSKTLFIIWVGANDYLPGIKNVDELTTKVASAISGAVENLIYYGGIHILVLNLPDLSLTPFAHQIETKVSLQSATVLHNIKLAAELAKVQAKNPNANIHLYQIDKKITDFVNHPEEHNKIHQTHITNVTEACWKGGYTGRANVYTEDMIANAFERHLQTVSRKKMADKESTPNPRELARFIASNPDLLETYIVGTEDKNGTRLCDDPDDYLFWDKVHPTSVAHRMIAEDLIIYIKQRFVDITQ